MGNIQHQPMTEGWVKPIENSIEAIRHGMVHTDGVEFDLRLTTDGQLVLFHDNFLSQNQIEQLGGSKWVEDWHPRQTADHKQGQVVQEVHAMSAVETNNQSNNQSNNQQQNHMIIL